MLTDAELASLRAEQERCMPSLCRVLRPVRSPDAYGGMAVVWQDAATNVPCRLASARPAEEEVVGEKAAGRKVWLLSLPWDADVRQSDRVVLDDETYEVLGERNGGDLMTARQVYLCEVR